MNLSSEYFYLNNAVLNLWRSQDIQVGISHGVFNILKRVSYLRHTQSNI